MASLRKSEKIIFCSVSFASACASLTRHRRHMYDNAIYIGRFQPVHSGHVALVQRALASAAQRDLGHLASGT